jgi:hypothetical protein
MGGRCQNRFWLAWTKGVIMESSAATDCGAAYPLVESIEGRKIVITAEDLAGIFARNVNILKRQVEGLSHQDSLLQPPFQGNCLNWVLGHIASYRSGIVELLGEKPVMTPEQAKRYAAGSAPVLADGPDVVKLETLIGMIEQAQEGISAGLKRATPADLARQIQTRAGPTPLAVRLVSLLSHESYHSGQPELLRELAAKK